MILPMILLRLSYWSPDKLTVLGNTFMAIFLLNLLVFSFDFSRIKSITIFIGVIATVLLVLWLDSKWEITNFLGRVFGGIDIQMNPSFYGFLSTGMGFLLLLVFINTRFNYYDVNPREIYDEGHLPSAIWMSSIELQLNALPQDRDAKVIFYCYNELCGASHQAASAAVAKGWRNVARMPAGIRGWHAAGLDIEE